MRYFVANFKQNLDQASLKSWVDSFKPTPSPDNQIILAPSYPLLTLPFIQSLRPSLSLAAQGVSPFPSGSHTIQVGASQLKGLVDYCLVGHSETRQDLAITNEQVAKQSKLLLNEGITPIICLDTPYLESQISALKPELLQLTGLIFAYEPLNAIGTGKPDTPSHANEIAFKIKSLTSSTSPVLYGGSVTKDNFASFLEQENINGFLVGKSSLNPQDFAIISS